MGTYPHLVQAAWDVVESFVTEWQKTPYAWIHEIDVQAEIYGRLMSLYRLTGNAYITRTASSVLPGLDKKQKFARVACEPYVQYTYSDGNSYRSHPDVVVWDDGSEDLLDSEDWPILWVCEIKYTYQKPDDWDQEKLRYVISQNRARFGCWLKLILNRADSGIGIKWDKDSETDRLWICEARLPPE